MLRLKSNFKRLVPAALLLTGMVTVGYAQKSPEDVKAKEVVYDKPNEYRIFATSTPPKAFAVQKNVLWYATEERVVEQPTTPGSKSMKPHPKLGGIPSAGVKAMAFDARGRLWAAGDNGAAMYSGTSWTSYTEADGLPSSAALSLAVAGNGEVWIGTEGGAARFRDGTWTKFTTADGLLSNKVQALAADSKGNIYLGTNKGMNVYDGSKFTPHTAKTTGSNGLEWNNITVMAKVPDKDIIWMTDGPRNLNTFDGKKWSRYSEIQEGITSILNDTRRTWIGSESGLFRYNGDEWISDPNVHGIPAEQVYFMFREDNGDLWFAMEKGVMMMKDPYRRK